MVVQEREESNYDKWIDYNWYLLSWFVCNGLGNVKKLKNFSKTY
jgi:hypothetical protein